MAFKPNYNQQRADRNRAKAQKKQEKLKRLDDETAKRKAHAAHRGSRSRQGAAGRLDRDEAYNEGTNSLMARRQQAQPSGFVLFDVFYEDGSQTSNRKVPATELGGLDGDEPARTFVEVQDRKIGEMSGRPRGRIKTIASRAKPRDFIPPPLTEPNGFGTTRGGGGHKFRRQLAVSFQIQSQLGRYFIQAIPASARFALAVAFVLSLGLSAAAKAETEVATMGGVITTIATVEAVDMTNRLLTVAVPEGNTMVIELGPPGLNQIHVGDSVVLLVSRSVAVKVTPV